jgi:hypothetical protein
MTKWQHCVLEWQPQQVTLVIYGQKPQIFPPSEWEVVFLRLGAEGWELVSTLTNPSGAQEYWYYFKRPMIS